MMDRLLQHSGWLKAFSLALAVLLWAMVVPRATKDVSRTFDVKLEVIQHPSFSIDQGPRNLEQSVQVRADARGPLVVLWLRQEKIRAVVDYSKIHDAGKSVQVPVELITTGNVDGVTYTVNPPTIPVVLVENREAAFPLVVEPATPATVIVNGHEWLYTAKADVEQVTLSGRSDYLNQVRVAKVVLDANDLMPANTKVTKAVVATDSTGKVLDKLAPQQATVTLTWRELPPGQAFKVQPVTRGTLPQGLVISSMEVQPTNLTVRAAEVGGRLPEKKVIETEPIDLTGKRLTFTATVRVVPPPGTTASAETVNVKVNISEVVQEKLFKGVPIQIRGAAPDATVTTAVTAVQVRVTGPYSVMNSLDVNHISAYVDVERLGAGKHSLPVKISAPAGVTATEADPATVEVTISPQEHVR